MSALSICIFLCAFIVVLSICLLYVSLRSRVINSILGLIFIFQVSIMWRLVIHE